MQLRINCMTSHLRVVNQKMLIKFFLEKEKMLDIHQNFSHLHCLSLLDPLRKNDVDIYMLEIKSRSSRVVNVVDRMW